MKDTFKRFNIKIDNDKVNIIGLDLGDGEYCAMTAFIKDGSVCTEYLRICGQDRVRRDMSMYCMKSADTEAVGDFAYVAAQEPENIKNNVVLYQSFKRPPTSLQARQNFAHSLNTLPHKVVMQRFFQKIMKDIFNNNEVLKYFQHTIVFVGRPASPIWNDNEAEYAKLLSDGLSEKLMASKHFRGKIDVVVYSEAEAVLASEVKRGNPNRSDKNLVIIDGGSSTYDAILIKGKEVITQVSWQVGASKIEHNLFDLIIAKYFGENEYTRIKDDIKHRHELRKRIRFTGGLTAHGALIIELRNRKEGYYGDRGDKTVGQLFTYEIEREEHNFIIDKNIIHVVTHEMEIEVNDNGEMGDQKFESFADAIKGFMYEVLKCCQLRNKAPDAVVLTGGSTVMPFIKEIAKEVFGEKNALGGEMVVRADLPNYSVVEGLAYMGYVELQVHLEEKKIFDAIDNAINIISEGIKNIISINYINAIWYENFYGELGEGGKRSKLLKWKEQPVDASLNQWWDTCYFSLPVSEITDVIKNTLTIDNSDGISLQTHIRTEIDNHIKHLLGVSETPFEIDFEMRDCVSRACKKMSYFKPPRLPISRMVGWITYLFSDIDTEGLTPLSSKTRKKVCDSMQNRSKIICEDILNEANSEILIVHQEFIKLLKVNLRDKVSEHIEKAKPYLIKRD